MISKSLVRPFLATSAVFVGVIAASGVYAQEVVPQQAPAPTVTSGDIDGSELDAFVMAYVEVNMIGQEFAPRLQEAATPEEQMQVQTEASEQMMGAIEGVEGIDLDRYNEIMTVAQSDNDLATRINTRLESAAATQ